MTEKNKPTPSATILLGRDGPSGLEVFMVVRHHQIDFASGALVFPGGKVDKEDFSKRIRKYCHGVDEVSDEVLGFNVSAIREVFEETGILLARKKGSDNIIPGTMVSGLKDYRERLVNKKITISEFLKKEELVLACDLLTHYAHWITPEVMPKRFDTYFYLVKAPEDHIGVHDGHESVDSIWISPQKALEDSESGKKTIIFPTRLNLSKLGQYKNIDEAILSVRSEPVFTVMPVVEDRDGEFFLCIPEAAGYGITEESLGKIGGNPKPA